MAVPSAILKQREKLQADLDAAATANGVESINLDVVPENPQVEVVPVAPVVEPQANTRIQELEHLLKTADGRASRAMRETNEARQRADVMASQIAALEQSIGTLQQQKDDAEARASSKQADLAFPNLDAPDDLTDQEREVFGKDSIGFVEKLTKKELLRYVKPLLDKVSALEKQVSRVKELDRLPQLETTVKNQVTEAQRLREEEFFRKEILAHFNDFETVRNTQEWLEYINAPIPGRGLSNRQLLDHYRNTNNAQGIRSLIQAHYDTLEAKPNLASIATPRGAQTEGTVSVKPKMKASEYQTNLRAFTSKRLPKDKWEKFKSEFHIAEKEGRIEMDARL